MNTTLFLLDVLKYTIAGLIVVFAAFYIGIPYLEQSKPVKASGGKKRFLTHTMPLRLQAYERIILFVERVNPANMLLRLHVSEISASEMHHLIISEIRNEFQHNIAQQLYLSSQAWAVVKRIKDDTIILINSAARSLPENASSLDLNKAVLVHLTNLGESPYDVALTIIKQDVQEWF